jgi:SagB-type dehydrogenase family enzyme
MRWFAVCSVVALVAACSGVETPSPGYQTVLEMRQLPEPTRHGGASLSEALAGRRSIRAYTDEPLSETAISDLLWAAQGVTAPGGKRTAPSAGALYPLETFVATAEGWYRYQPNGHRLEVLGHDDLREALARAALGQEEVAAGAAVFVITGVYSRTESKYGARAARYVHLEAGHAAQNLLLQATALGLGAVPIGAFDDADVQAVLGLPADHQPLYLIPVGRPAS